MATDISGDVATKERRAELLVRFEPHDEESPKKAVKKCAELPQEQSPFMIASVQTGQGTAWKGSRLSKSSNLEEDRQPAFLEALYELGWEMHCIPLQAVPLPPLALPSIGLGKTIAARYYNTIDGAMHIRYDTIEAPCSQIH